MAHMSLKAVRRVHTWVPRARYEPIWTPRIGKPWRKTESEWRDLARAASLSPARAGGGIARNAGAGGDGRDESRLCAGGLSPRACCPTKTSRPRIRSAVVDPWNCRKDAALIAELRRRMTGDTIRGKGGRHSSTASGARGAEHFLRLMRRCY